MEHQEVKIWKGETDHPTQFDNHSPVNPQASDRFSTVLLPSLWSWFLPLNQDLS